MPRYQGLLTEIRTLPGVLSAATSSGVPLAGGNTVTECNSQSKGVQIDSRPLTGA